MTPVERVLDLLAGVHQVGDRQWEALCSAHEDSRPSLSIAEGEDGRVLLTCHRGCSHDAVVERLGLKVADLFPERQATSNKRGRITTAYDYRNEAGELVYQVARFDPKDFRQRRPDPARPGEWLWSLKGVERIPYRLPEVVAAVKAGRTIFIPEGEKDVAALESLGLVATCNPGGAGKWLDSFARYFHGALVVVIPDNDDIDREHARDVATKLRGVAKNVRVVELPGLGPKGDAANWVAAGGTVAALKVLVKAAAAGETVATVATVAGGQSSSRGYSAGDTKAGDTRPDAAPLPLHRDLPPPEPYPVDALGDVLGPMANVLHEMVKAPLATCAQSVLAAAAVVVQAHADVEVDGRTSPTSCNLVTVADSGERKSGVDRRALAPHRKYQHDLSERHTEEMVEHAADVEAWRKAKEETLKSAKGREAKRQTLLDLGPEPVLPASPVVLTAEPTLVGLQKALQHRSFMGLFSDEGGMFVNGHSMADDKRLGTLAGLSKLWDGDPLDRVRGGDGASLLYGRRVSSHLMLQPVAAERLLGDPLASGQGYLARCLVTWPASSLGTMTYVEGDLSTTPDARRYFACIMHLLESTPAALELHPRPLAMAPDAKATWVKLHDWCQRLLVAEGPLRPIKAFAAKAAEHALRLAGVLATVEDPATGEVQLRHVEAGAVLVRYYLEEALRLRAVGDTSPDLIAAASLLAWLKARTSRLTPIREVYQFGPSSLRDRTTAGRLLGLLAEHGWVRPVGALEIDGIRHREVWEVRP